MGQNGTGWDEVCGGGEWRGGNGGVEQGQGRGGGGNRHLLPSLRSFEKQIPKWGSGCRLIGGVACERQKVAMGPFRGRGYPGPCEEGWARRVSQKGWTSAPTAQAWLGAAPGEMDLCANQGTSGHSRGAASSCSLGWTQPPVSGISPGMDRATEKGSKQHLKGRQPEPRGH